MFELGLKGYAGFEQQREVGRQDALGKEQYFQGKTSRPIWPETRYIEGRRGTRKAGRGRIWRVWTARWRLVGSIYREGATRKISLLRKEVMCFRPFAEDVSGVVDRLAGGWSA